MRKLHSSHFGKKLESMRKNHVRTSHCVFEDCWT